MAENKKSVLLYCDIIHTVEALDDQEAGILFKHYLRYINDLDPVAPDKLTQIVFEPIKQNLKRDLKKWESALNSRSEAGRIGGIKSGETRRKQNEAKRSNASKNEANEAVTVNVTVTDKVIVKDIESNTEKFTPDLSKSNLFRQPSIPTLEKVIEKFLSAGGNEKMAAAFFEKNSATGWFLRGSPITNFINLIPSFILNWKENDAKRITTNNPKLGTSAARIEAARKF